MAMTISMSSSAGEVYLEMIVHSDGCSFSFEGSNADMADPQRAKQRPTLTLLRMRAEGRWMKQGQDEIVAMTNLHGRRLQSGEV